MSLAEEDSERESRRANSQRKEKCRENICKPGSFEGQVRGKVLAREHAQIGDWEAPFRSWVITPGITENY